MGAAARWVGSACSLGLSSVIATIALSAAKICTTTHCRSPGLASTSVWIDGKATLTTDRSSTVIATTPHISADIELWA